MPPTSADDGQGAARESRVDFSYSFAPPHRLTVGPPDCSDRTLLDLQPGSLRMAWSYDDLTGYPPAAFKTPPTAWDLRLTPEVDGRPISDSRWSRVHGYLPALDNTYDAPEGGVHLRVYGGRNAAVMRVEVRNADTQAHRFALRCDSAAWGENPAWVDPARWVGDNLVAGWAERADRVLVLGVGADAYSLRDDGFAPGPRTMILVWDVPPGESRTGWVVRPYRAYAEDLDSLRGRDWAQEQREARREWEALLGRASRVTVPDQGVEHAFLACLADLFIMREPGAQGYVAAVPGTEVYRAHNAHESAVLAVALDQMGFHDEAAQGYRLCLEIQEPDGNWADPKGWAHLVWSTSGFKAWAAMEHYRLTGDRDFLARVYPRLVASARFQERERARTRAAHGEERPLTHGLMPRGMGDCGLMDDGDLYGVFIPHNIWAVYADKLALEAAETLGRAEDVEELRSIYEAGLRDLLAAMDRGAVQEEGCRWIPGVPGKTSGSRWGVLNAFFPCRLLPGDHELIEGTLRKIEGHTSPGGIPVHTGWMADGMWVAITLDNVAEAHLARGDGDAAAAYLYATLNHGTPLHTWCEERGQEPNTTQCSGDRQHLWTPVAVVRCLRDCLVMEDGDGDGLHLALGTDREWLGGGGPVGIEQAATPFGAVSYEMRYDAGAGRVTGTVGFERRLPVAWIAVHVRLPGGLVVRTVSTDGGAATQLLPNGEGFLWKSPEGTLAFEAHVRAR